MSLDFDTKRHIGSRPTPSRFTPLPHLVSTSHSTDSFCESRRSRSQLTPPHPTQAPSESTSKRLTSDDVIKYTKNFIVQFQEVRTWARRQPSTPIAAIKTIRALVCLKRVLGEKDLFVPPCLELILSYSDFEYIFHFLSPMDASDYSCVADYYPPTYPSNITIRNTPRCPWSSPPPHWKW